MLAVSPAQADESASVARQLLKEGKIMPLQEILTKAKVIKPGQVIETDLEKDDGRYIYELEILDEQGQVWELELDAQTGEFVELENEDN
ncbi:lipoprotein, putative [Methylophaga aminisulfidivorans MP]|uniref:Lipoprotein, putative n=1 Tax=Methylophaga aminisulfidivorans MP TaxID=1026882 RepID=F5T1R3_9GAMM|nr:lipoprotein, putative [Methylophaga aminisulfidivorans MP]